MAQKAATVLAEPKRLSKTPPIVSFRAKMIKASVLDDTETKETKPKERGKERAVAGIGKKGGRKGAKKPA